MATLGLKLKNQYRGRSGRKGFLFGQPLSDLKANVFHVTRQRRHWSFCEVGKTFGNKLMLVKKLNKAKAATVTRDARLPQESYKAPD